MSFRILAVIMAILLGFATGIALMTELRQPTQTVVEPIDLERRDDVRDDEDPRGKRPSESDGKGRQTGDVDTGDDDPGAQPVPALPPPRAGGDDADDGATDDDLDDAGGDSDDGSDDDD